MKNILYKQGLAILMALLSVCGVSTAQNIKFGIKAGPNLPNITAGGKNTPVSEGYKSRAAVGAGIFTELQLNPLISFRLGVEYSGQGGKKNGMQAMPSQRLVSTVGNSMGMSITDQQIEDLTAIASHLPTYYYADINNTTKFDYVMIPLLAQFGWNLGQSPWRVYVNAGPFVSFLISGKQVSKGTSKMYSDASGTSTLWDILPPTAKDMVTGKFPAMEPTLNDPVDYGATNITGEMKSTNFGITGNAGIRYQCNRNYFFLELGGNYGFITVQENSANGSNRLGAGSVMVGYAFSLF
ncbi:MAG: PorT family protein [Bacteroidales bacterium]|jgi:hypothetical protein|nr:PorT family protein [Bacteroidales bacterium]